MDMTLLLLSLNGARVGGELGAGITVCIAVALVSALAGPACLAARATSIGWMARLVAGMTAVLCLIVDAGCLYVLNHHLFGW